MSLHRVSFQGYTVLFITLISLSATTQFVQAATIHVNAEGTGDYPTIQAAIIAANDWDVIVLEDGTYTGQWNRDIQLDHSVMICSTSDDPSSCIIDCEGESSCFIIIGERYGRYHIKGITITNGQGFWEQGGGITCNGVYGLKVTNCIISDCSANTGGGIFCRNSSVILQKCVFRNNVAPIGGGIACQDDFDIAHQLIKLENCEFSGNMALGSPYNSVLSSPSGGGMCSLNCSPVLSNCMFHDNTAGSGGGIYCYQDSDSSVITPVLVDCEFSDNTAFGAANDYSHGGGMACDGISPALTRCVFRDNDVYGSGGGLSVFSPTSLQSVSAKLLDCLFIGNTTYGNDGWNSCGGGMVCYNGNPELSHCRFFDNYSPSGGGLAVSPLSTCENGVASLQNCEFAGNVAVSWQDGGGIFIPSGYDSEIVNCTFVGNGPNAIYSSETNMTVANSIFWENLSEDLSGAASVNYCNFQRVIPDGIGNISIDPLFRDFDGPDNNPNTWEDNDYQLSPGSACIDAGSNDHVLPDRFDVDGDGDTSEPTPLDVNASIRFMDDPGISDSGEGSSPIVDMGASEFQGESMYSLRVPYDYETIQAAIIAASEGDVVEIASGVYRGEGNKNLQFDGKAITVRSAVGDPEVCIIDCEYQGRGFVFSSHEGSDSIVQGLTVRNGYETVGGGVYCDQSSPTFVDCIVENNTAELGGGMYFSEGSASSLSNCQFSDNTAESTNLDSLGGGIFSGQSDLHLSGCLFEANTSEHAGGGLYIDSGQVSIVNCVFAENGAFRGGGVGNQGETTFINSRFFGNSSAIGGAFHSLNSTSFTNCIFSENTAGDGACIFSVSASLVLVNCNLIGNTALLNEGGSIRADGNTDIRNSILWGNSPGDFSANGSTPQTLFSVVQGSSEPGCFFADPMFSDTDGPDNDSGTWQDNDYSLSSRSPCVDAGSNNAVPVDLLDIDGDGDVEELTPFDANGMLRFLDDIETEDSGEGVPPLVDMGACEFQGTGGDPAILLVPSEYYPIQIAIDVASAGDIIEIASGIYTGSGNKNLQFNGKGLTVRSSSDDPSLCIIDCENVGTGFIFQSGDSNSVISGMTILNAGGEFTAWDGYGIFCEGVDPEIRNCVLRGNSRGGLNNAAQADPTVVDCVFDSNWGTGMLNMNNSNPIVQGCVFQENLGGGMRTMNDSSPDLQYCIFNDNWSESGGGIYTDANSNPSITNCTFEGNSAASGGGVYGAGNSSPVIRNCTFDGNSSGSGGGVYIDWNSSSTIDSSSFRNNTAYSGAGIYNAGSSGVQITWCSFTENWASAGAGVYNSSSNPSLMNCEFRGNYGEGMYNSSSDPSLMNCLFVGNSGDGMINALSHPSLVNCVIAGHLFGSGINNDDDSAPSITNSILWNNENEVSESDSSMSVTYSCIRGGYPGVGNLSRNPKFVDVDGPDNIPGTQDDDLHLQADSPCNGSGSDAAIPADQFDLDDDENLTEPVPIDLEGNARVLGGVDMGVYEHVAPLPPSPVVYDRIYVNASSTPGGDGSSWSSALIYLQDALDIAGSGAEIWVAVGLYYPDQWSDSPEGTGNRNESFWLVDGVAIFGGFSGDEASRSQRQADPDPFVVDSDTDTILTGDISIAENPSDNSYHVVRSCAVSQSTILDSVTIVKGNAVSSGGGMLNQRTNPSIRTCSFIDNSAAEYGGGICNINSSPSIFNCTCFENMVIGDDGSGGGMSNLNASYPVVYKCLFNSNSADQRGGGVFNFSSSPVFINCGFDGNAAGNHYDGEGGGIYNLSASDPHVCNCLFTGNSAGDYGGGMYSESSTPVLTNNVFSDNTAYRGGGLYNDNSSPVVKNCILWGDAPQEIYNVGSSSIPVVRFSLVQNGTGEDWFGIKCVDADPVFVDPDGPDDDPATWKDNDYRLGEGSPCIDAGSNGAIPSDVSDLDGDGNTSEAIPFDFDGRSRFQDVAGVPDTGEGDAPIVDMGAFEYNLALFVDAAATGACDGSSWEDAFPSIHEAINSDATEIIVAGGEYFPSVEMIPGDSRSATFRLLTELEIRGGYAGSNNTGNPNERNIDLYPTILSGDIGVQGESSDNCYHVITGTGLDNSAVLDGFTISGGNSEGADSPGSDFMTHGGGPVLRNITVSSNESSCGGGFYCRGGVLSVDNVRLSSDADNTGLDCLGGINGSILHMKNGGMVSELKPLAVYNSLFDSADLCGLVLESGSQLSIRSSPICQAVPVAKAEGLMDSTQIYLKIDDVIAEWFIVGVELGQFVLHGAGGQRWSLQDASLTWTGNELLEDRSEGGRAEAIFQAGGTLKIEGSVLEEGKKEETPIFTGLLLQADVGGFYVRETSTDSSKLEFISHDGLSNTPQIVPIAGFLFENEQNFVLSGYQILKINFADAVQSRSALTDFSSHITLQGESTLVFTPLHPLDSKTEFRCNLLGTGDVVIEPNAVLAVTNGAVVDLSGQAPTGCADPTESPNWGTITVNGELQVQDATVQNTNVEVYNADIQGTVDIINNDIRLLETSDGFGGQFFVEGDSLIRCNYITSYGDRYLDLDPDPTIPQEQRPTFEDNVIDVIISQGVAADQGTLLELRARDWDCSSDCESGAYQLSNSDGYGDIWALNILEIQPDAKVNLTNRQGFDYNESDQEDVVYVKKLKLHPGAILNTGLQRLYYQELVDENDTPIDPSQPHPNGSEIVDIPLLGFSLVVIGMDDDTPPPHNEFDVRVRTRLTDPVDVQPFEPPYYQGIIVRTEVENPVVPGTQIGVMEMKTKADSHHAAASVAAKGAFARAGDEYITVTFDYLWQGEGELYVYMSDYPDVSECAGTNGFESCHKLMAVLTPPEPGLPGSIGCSEFATFRGRFPSQELNFTRGTYVELELRGSNAHIWIDNWDPQIECHSTYCADLDKSASVDGIDYCLLSASLGESFDDNQETHWCLDNGLSNYDGYVDYIDLMGWDAFLSDPTNDEFAHLCTNPIQPEVTKATTKDSIPAGAFSGNYVLAGKQTAQDDTLLTLSPTSITCTSEGLTQIVDTGIESYFPQCPDCTRGNGVLETTHVGELYQVHGIHGIVRVEDGQTVVPPATFEDAGTNGVVCVGVVGDNPSGLPGLPLMDMAVDPTDETVLYVVPVLVVPNTPDRCPYTAAAKLTLTAPETGSYELTTLYSGMAGRTRYNSECDPVMSHPNPQNQREIAVDGAGTVYVLSASYGFKDYLLTYEESTGILAQKVHLSPVLRSPSAMAVDAESGRLYLSSSLGSTTEETSDHIRVPLESYSFTPGNPWASVTHLGIENVDLPTAHCQEQGYPFRGVITSVQCTDQVDRYILGMVLPIFPQDQTFTLEDPLYMSPCLAYLPAGQSGPFTAAALEVHDLSIPLSFSYVPTFANGDMDQDGDVDLADFAAFQRCFGSAQADCLSVFDFNGDLITDLNDFGRFEYLITGVAK